MKKGFINRNKNLILIVSGLLLLLLLFLMLSYVNIESFLQKKGFSKYDEATYYKKISKLTKDEFQKNINNDISSEYDYLYFGLGTYHISEEIGVYDDEVLLEYIGEYNYKSRMITYSIRGDYYSTAIQFAGKYDVDTHKFICNPLLHYDIDYDSEVESTICELTKYHSINLYNTSVNFIDNEKVLNEVIKKTQ